MRAIRSIVAEKLGFQIIPRKKRGGFTLHSSIFLFPLSYKTLNEAVHYARFLGRDRGCVIDIRDSKGRAIDRIELDDRCNQRMCHAHVTLPGRATSPRAVQRRRWK